MKTIAAVICLSLSAAYAADYDVVVVGATPGGIGAALSAARLGHSVALVEYHNHVGGMSASGLGKSDITKLGAIGGLWDEFTVRVKKHYSDTYGENSDQVAKCKNGYFYEPSVAETIFRQMLSEQKKITLYLGYRLDEVVRADKTVTAVRITDKARNRTRELRAKVFVDATYEGDLSAYAGAAYRVGRESRAEFDEPHAGVIYMDHNTRALLPGTTGEADDRLVAYTYRLCLTTTPENRILPAQPAEYDRTRYLNYFLDLKLGRIDSAVKALSIAEIPNGKYDANMKPWPLGFPFAEENKGYAEANWIERDKMDAHLRNITLGLLYFLQNDPDVPAADRELARTYGLPRDEFTDNENFPWQLYVREARRLVGTYTLNENDLTSAPGMVRAPTHRDAISAGEFPIDSFPTRKYEPGHEDALEGYILMLDKFTQPYQIPYGAMIPKDVEGLIVPVPCSTTHIAFSSVRLEPTWMSLGQAAGVAAHLAITGQSRLREINPTEIQAILLDQGQVLTYFDDLPKTHPAFKAFQFFGTRGFFRDYHARPDVPLTLADARWWSSRLARPSEQYSQSADDNRPVTAAEWTELKKEANAAFAIPQSTHPAVQGAEKNPATAVFSRADALTQLFAEYQARSCAFQSQTSQ